MTAVWTLVSVLLCAAGSLFIVAGSTGLLRCPDVYTRLHALTKADNLGLGLISLGIAMQADSGMIAFKVLLIWVLALVASTTSCNLIAHAAMRGGIQPWRSSAENERTA
jgi:multicomponent Na+:H+ antiporter subunit G